MKVLVCGGRKWDDPMPIRLALSCLADQAVARGETLTVVHGAALGADRLAQEIAQDMGDVEEKPYPAYWNRQSDGSFDRAAGHKRNKRMLDENPDVSVVIAFKDGFDWSYKRGGTEHMIRTAKEAGKLTYVVSHG